MLLDLRVGVQTPAGVVEIDVSPRGVQPPVLGGAQLVEDRRLAVGRRRREERRLGIGAVNGREYGRRHLRSIRDAHAAHTVATPRPDPRV